MWYVTGFVESIYASCMFVSISLSLYGIVVC